MNLDLVYSNAQPRSIIHTNNVFFYIILIEVANSRIIILIIICNV